MTLNWRSFPVGKISGAIVVPGDKSISHRAIMLGALAEGRTEVTGFLEGEDCLATIRAFQMMGVPIAHHGNGSVTIDGQGLHGLQAPAATIDVGNSGTGMRLLAGVLAGQRFDSVIVGDASLMQRPMRRIAKPLTAMGAEIVTSDAGTAPLRIRGKRLSAIDYALPVASAQLKSCLLFAALYADGVTRLTECGPSRDHSERMLRGFGLEIGQQDNTLSLAGGQTLQARAVVVPGDVSSAAFFMVAALIAPDADVLIKNVGINPTRAAVIDILQSMGGQIEVLNPREAGGEPVADIRVRSSDLRGIDIEEKHVPIAIDEFPIIFVAAACATGTTTARGVAELRVKECDRIAAMETGLSALGIECSSEADSVVIHGGQLQGGVVDSHSDHRIAMSFAVAAIVASGSIEIKDCANVATSFPTFRQLAESVGMQIEVDE